MDHMTLWEQACSLMREDMTEVTFNTWISSALKPVALKDDHFYIETATDFYYRFVQPRYNELITNALTQCAGHKITAKLMPPAEAKEFMNGAAEMEKKAQSNIGRSMLNPRYTFSSFVVGNNNRFAHAAALAVAESPNEAFNPLFIYGGVGLGKTHLMQAIGHYILDERPDTRICYLTAEAFTNEVINNIQNSKSANEFREKYRNFDVLMIDDIQFISGTKGKTQEQFFHIFNWLHQRNKQIIITADKSPVEIAGFEARLLNRFKWGLAADLQIPDLETRIAIITQKLENNGIKFPKEVIDYLALRVTSNTRELEGAMIAILAQASLNHRDITVDLAKEMVDKYVKSNAKEISIEYIQKIICDYFKIPTDTINANTRKREIVQARQLSMYFAKKYTKLPLSLIGAYCGNKDHATVLHACKTVSNLYETDKKMKLYVDDIDKKMKI